MRTWLSLQRVDPSYLYHKSERLWVSVCMVSPVTQTWEGGKRKEGGRERREARKEERRKREGEDRERLWRSLAVGCRPPPRA